MAGKRRHEYDVVVLGGGIAGLTAVSYAGQYGLSAALLEANLFGGQVATVTTIEGYPATVAPSGADLAATLLEDARGDGVDIIEQAVQALEIDGRQFKISTQSQTLRSRAVVVATGARLRPLDVPGAAALIGRGISHCASCDGPLFRGEDVVVVGGGDSALQEAALLAPLCRSVTIVVRNHLRARHKFVKRIKAHGNIRIIWDCMIDAVLGQATVAGVRLRNKDDGTLSEIACTGVFPFIGTLPNREFLAGVFKQDDDGGLVTDGSLACSQAGIYAAGAIRSGFSGELCSAAGEGAAAMKAIAAQLR